MAKKRLTPLPFEAVQAASEWLLERFDQGLSCVENPTSHIPGYVEGGVTPILTVPRASRIRPVPFQFAYTNQRHWIRTLREGQTFPTQAVPFDTIHVVPHLFPELNRWIFTATYEGQQFKVSINDEVLARYENEYVNVVANRLTDQFRIYDAQT